MYLCLYLVKEAWRDLLVYVAVLVYISGPCLAKREGGRAVPVSVTVPVVVGREGCTCVRIFI